MRARKRDRDDRQDVTPPCLSGQLPACPANSLPVRPTPCLSGQHSERPRCMHHGTAGTFCDIHALEIHPFRRRCASMDFWHILCISGCGQHTFVPLGHRVEPSPVGLCCYRNSHAFGLTPSSTYCPFMVFRQTTDSACCPFCRFFVFFLHFCCAFFRDNP